MFHWEFLLHQSIYNNNNIITFALHNVHTAVQSFHFISDITLACKPFVILPTDPLLEYDKVLIKCCDSNGGKYFLLQTLLNDEIGAKFCKKSATSKSISPYL